MTKKHRGAVRALLSKGAGLSMPQITRLIRSYRKTERFEYKAGRGASSR